MVADITAPASKSFSVLGQCRQSGGKWEFAFKLADSVNGSIIAGSSNYPLTIPVLFKGYKGGEIE